MLQPGRCSWVTNHSVSPTPLILKSRSMILQYYYITGQHNGLCPFAVPQLLFLHMDTATQNPVTDKTVLSRQSLGSRLQR